MHHSALGPLRRWPGLVSLLKHVDHFAVINVMGQAAPDPALAVYVWLSTNPAGAQLQVTSFKSSVSCREGFFTREVSTVSALVVIQS